MPIKGKGNTNNKNNIKEVENVTSIYIHPPPKQDNKQKLVLLKNGSEVSEAVCTAVMTALRSLLNSSDITDNAAFYDLVKRCKNPNYEFPREKLYKPTQFAFSDRESVLDRLIDKNLVGSNGKPTSSTIDVVLSAVEGDKWDLKIVDPRQEEESSQPSFGSSNNQS